MAVGMKQGDLHGRVVREGNKWQRGLMIFFTLFMVILIGAGEMLALLALMRGSGTTVQAGYVWAAISTLLFIVVMEFAGPVDRALGKIASAFFSGMILVAWMSSIFLFGLLAG